MLTIHSLVRYTSNTKQFMEFPMRFQPGQSGNPAGRPPGSRNKATIAREQELAERASKAVRDIIDWAQRGNAVAMRICAEWARPSGANRSPALELPPIACSDDAQVALDTVLEAFGSGALTSRELPIVLGGVERAVRIADRIQQMREREREGRQIRGELHPSMLPRPVAPDPLVEAMRAAGEDVPEYLASAAAVHDHDRAGLYSPVNSGEESSAAPAPEASSQAAAEAEDLYSPVNSSAEETGPAADAPPVGAEPSAAEGIGLYFPVNSSASEGDEPPPGAAVGGAGDIGRKRAPVAALAGDDVGCLLRGREVHVGAEHLGALAGAGDGSGLAVAPAGADRAGTGDERDLVLQAIGHGPFFRRMG
jgi:hypothetical protein